MYLNLLENEQTVELFKQSPYSEKFQREMTVAEYSAGMLPVAAAIPNVINLSNSII